ncbi:hypothetical protein CCL24_25670 [Pseudomonas congelans]|nr:hypothetical protein CCL24_25670 [Pseudomonas congelans]
MELADHYYCGAVGCRKTLLFQDPALPADQTQKTLKMIRELKQKIEDLRAEIDALMADQSMDPETKKSRVGAL